MWMDDGMYARHVRGWMWMDDALDCNPHALLPHVRSEYGDGQVPGMLKPGALTTLTAGLALAPRWG